MDNLKFIALSGTTGVTQNFYIYEYKNDLIIVDCGVGFPEPEMFGVDLVIPDFNYVKKNKNKIKGILITHGHEDHFGALPFLLKEIDVPIYASKLVAGFIEDKFRDYKIKKYRLNIFDPEKDVLNLGVFRIHAFRTSHSVPDSVGFMIGTPQGNIFHVPDYKFDWTPVDARPFDINKAANLAANGCLALASDCLGATTPGYTESEKEIEQKIERIIRSSKGNVFFTTISSNISRMQQAINVAKKLSRKIVFVGRSIQAKSEIAKNLGFLSYPKNLILDLKNSRDTHDRLIYIISGSYGQPGSALSRVAQDEHNLLSIEKDDVVIFSSDPAPPGSKLNVDVMVDKFIEKDIDVHYYDLQEDLHVSGHGSQEDIKMLIAVVKPKYLIPIGGTIRHMRAHRVLAGDLGFDPKDVFELMPGDSINFKASKASLGEKIKVKDVLVDGLGIGDVGNVVLRDRKILSRDGVAIVLINYDSSTKRVSEAPEIISRGFVFNKNKDPLIRASKQLLSYLNSKKGLDRHAIKRVSVDFLEKHFYSKLGRRPMILPVIVEI